MPTAAPLQILVFRHPDDRDVAPYQKALLRAFQGGEEAGNYLATGDDLGLQLEIFPGVPVLDPAHALDAFSHTVTVVFIDRGLLDKGGDQLWDWLSRCWTLTGASNGRHAMLAVAMDERVGRLYTAGLLSPTTSCYRLMILAKARYVLRCSHCECCTNAESGLQKPYRESPPSPLGIFACLSATQKSTVCHWPIL